MKVAITGKTRVKKVVQKLDESWLKVGSKLVQSWMKVRITLTLKSAQSWIKFGSKLNQISAFDKN